MMLRTIKQHQNVICICIQIRETYMLIHSVNMLIHSDLQQMGEAFTQTSDLCETMRRFPKCCISIISKLFCGWGLTGAFLIMSPCSTLFISKGLMVPTGEKVSDNTDATDSNTWLEMKIKFEKWRSLLEAKGLGHRWCTGRQANKTKTGWWEVEIQTLKRKTEGNDW